MGPTTLVSREQVQGGEDLIRALPQNGVVVTGAAWARVEGDGQPYLYVVSPTIETDGPLEAAGRLVTTYRKLEQGWTDPFRRIDLFAIKLIGPSDTLGQAITLWYQQHPDAIPTIYRGPILGRSSAVALDEAYIYPAKMFDAPAAPSA
jgi:hypothetical protein